MFSKEVLAILKVEDALREAESYRILTFAIEGQKTNNEKRIVRLTNRFRLIRVIEVLSALENWTNAYKKNH